MSITKLTLQQIASELPLCNRVAFCWSSSSSSSTSLFTQKLSSYLSDSSSSVCRVGETLLVFIHDHHNRNNSNNDLTILLSFIHSVSSSSSSCSKLQFAFIDLQLTKQQQQRNDDVDIFSDHNSLFSDSIKIQMIIDPIYSSTIKLPRQEVQNIYTNSDDATDHDNHGNTNNNNSNILKMSHLVVPEEIIVLMMTRGQKANVETLLLDFFTTSLSSSSTSVVKWRRLFAADQNEDDNNNSNKIHHTSSKNRTEVLISRYCELFEIKDAENNKQPSTPSSMGNWQSTAVSNDERKWSVFVTQKMLSSSSSGSKTKNDASIHGENTNDDNHENYFQGLSQHQVKTAAPALLSLFSNPVKISMHYERMLHDASNTIIDRRKQHASPLRKVMKYLSPVSSNHHNQDDGATQSSSSRIEIGTNKNNNVDDDDENDDETEAILRALTEKKKSMTLAKKAEEWFAELSSRGVPAPLKGLAMSLSYQYRFWLTPMGFLVIGSCLMLLMGVWLLFI